MSKTGLFLISLVAAIPGGFLAVRLALDFLNRAEHMETMLKVVSALTLAISALVMLLPIAILIFSPKDEVETESAVAPAPASSGGVSKADVAVVAESESEVIISPSDEFRTDASGDVSAFEDEMVTEDGLDVFEDEMFEDEEKPKK